MSEWSNIFASAARLVADQQVGRVAGGVADLEHRCRGADETGHVKNGLQARPLRDAERDDGMGVAVHDGHHVRPAAEKGFR